MLLSDGCAGLGRVGDMGQYGTLSIDNKSMIGWEERGKRDSYNQPCLIQLKINPPCICLCLILWSRSQTLCMYQKNLI